MPETKLTWARLKEHLRKTLWIYIVGCLVLILLSDIVFTATRPRTPEEQVVKFYVADAYVDSASFDETAQSILETVQAEDETLLEVVFEGVNFSDPESDYYGTMVLMVRMAAGDGDVYLANEAAYNYISNSEAMLPLDEYLDAGWLSQYSLEYATYTNPETGETYINAVSLDTMDGLHELGFNNKGAYLGLAANTTNLESTMKAVEALLALMAG